MAHYVKVTPPAAGQPIRFVNGKLNVPDLPIIPFIEGDGTGPDIWRASQRVFDAAVAKAYGGKRKIIWFEVFAGEKANAVYGPTHGFTMTLSLPSKNILLLSRAR